MAYEITIADPDGTLEATFIPEAGMIGSSLRHEGEELFDQRDGLVPYVDHGSTFGLPLLHPWANRVSGWDFELAGRRVVLDPDSPITHRDGATGTAIHGLLTASTDWVLVDADKHTLTAELDFGAVPAYIAAFPFPHRVRYVASIREATLTVAFTVIGGDSGPVPISFGFHPYLTLPGSDRRGWHVEIPAARQALIDERMIPDGATAAIGVGELDGPLGERTFDTSYDRLHEPAPAFVVADERRRLTLTHIYGYPVAQVYAPEASQFICFEPMTAPVDALISGDGLRWVQPGEEFEAIFTISVDKS
jgi:galactose mutarotase-like enzyme